ncbi:MAG: PAS domain S-box protein [Candidatus Viridilinea halotolerans]|uniref:histidine kinase n=1 Tax=Candidatus Viridilinea halotolerans TaxID=2491704 RepID=A0A426U426_9CHLR|nr:MAG: PAS domain S-box protein [Candidatus Viridilinea halotolerans]
MAHAIRSYQEQVAEFQQLLHPRLASSATSRVAQRSAFAELERQAGRLETHLYTTLGDILLAQERRHVATLLAWGTALLMLGSHLYRGAQARERAAVQLQASEARLEGILQSAMDAIIVVDQQRRIMLFNTAAEQIFGCSRMAMIGAPVDQLLPERYHDLLTVDAAQQSLANMHILMAQRSDGSEFPIEASLARIVVEDQPLLTLILRDVTARKRLEAQYLQAQKMETVGRLAGGVAHDFNNLLTVIGGYAELVRADLPANDPLDGDVAQIQAAADRAVRLTRQLLAFARKQMISPVIIDLNQLIQDLDPLLRRLLGADLKLMFHLDPELGTVQVDPGQIEQVIVNLAVNARDAMPAGGQLTVRTTFTQLEEPLIHGEFDLAAGEYVVLQVSDTGSGIPKALQAKVFEPFFTTKGPDKGTGLGLATCYGIVCQHNGAITLYSEPGLGTTVVIYLPQVLGAKARAAQPSKVPPLPRGNETVLLVEDDEHVRALALRILNQQGYVVLEAANGNEALRIFTAQTPRPIALLVSDVVMPELGGPALAEALRNLQPDLKWLFMSGYADHPLLQQESAVTQGHFLQKPFSPSSLARRVREVLDG